MGPSLRFVCSAVSSFLAVMKSHSEAAARRFHSVEMSLI